MQKRTIAMIVAAGCAVGMLTGCGISEEEHNAIITQLKTENQEVVDKLNGKLADLESVKKSEQAKVRTARIELDDAAEKIKSLQKKQAETAKSLADQKAQVATLERNLKSAKSSAAAAREDADEASDKLATVEAELKEITRRFDQFRKNMMALSAPAPAKEPAAAAPAVEEAAPMFEEVKPAAAPEKKKISALDILNDMSTK